MGRVQHPRKGATLQWVQPHGKGCNTAMAAMLQSGCNAAMGAMQREVVQSHGKECNSPGRVRCHGGGAAPSLGVRHVPAVTHPRGKR